VLLPQLLAQRASQRAHRRAMGEDVRDVTAAIDALFRGGGAGTSLQEAQRVLILLEQPTSEARRAALALAQDETTERRFCGLNLLVTHARVAATGSAMWPVRPLPLGTETATQGLLLRGADNAVCTGDRSSRGHACVAQAHRDQPSARGRSRRKSMLGSRCDIGAGQRHHARLASGLGVFPGT
jgi:hypothetical protein